jgi:Protein of unknown function (DUF2442)
MSERAQAKLALVHQMHYRRPHGHPYSRTELEDRYLWAGAWHSAFPYRRAGLPRFGGDYHAGGDHWRCSRAHFEGSAEMGVAAKVRIVGQMAGVELMNKDNMRTIESVTALDGDKLHLRWSDGTEAEIAVDPKLRTALSDDTNFRAVKLGEWGHSIEWPDGTDLSANRLWSDTLEAIGRSDASQFLAWRWRNGLSLNQAAEALGIARRTVAYYSNGDRPVPKAILLACRGWEVSPKRKQIQQAA